MAGGDQWKPRFEGRDIPQEYRIMSYPLQEFPSPIGLNAEKPTAGIINSVGGRFAKLQKA